MKNLFRPYLAFLLIGGLLSTTACKKDEEPEPDAEHDFITTVTLTLVPTDAGKPTVTATWEDLDGPGGNAAVIDNLTLSANTTYSGTLVFLSEEDHDGHRDTHDLTEEIREEGEVHEVFYVVTPQGLATFQKTDNDANNRPIGLETTVSTTAVGSGTVRIVLKHQPGLKSNSSNINTGETDVDIVFPTTVQ